MREVIQTNKTSPQDELISRLNPIIRGWSNYHQGAVAKEIFSNIDHTLHQMLWTWAKRRHKGKSRRWIKQRYWKTGGSRRWVFKDNKKLMKMSDKKIVRHTRLKLDQNPYIDEHYFTRRKINLQANKMSGRYKNIWIK